jgi:hypothetical protein
MYWLLVIGYWLFSHLVVVAAILVMGGTGHDQMGIRSNLLRTPSLK